MPLFFCFPTLTSMVCVELLVATVQLCPCPRCYRITAGRTSTQHLYITHTDSDYWSLQVVALDIHHVAESTSPQSPCSVYTHSFRLLLPPTRQLCFPDLKIIPRSCHDITVFISAFHKPCLTVDVSVDIGRQGRNGNLFYGYSRHEIFQC
jgi:hypothetical protein